MKKITPELREAMRLGREKTKPKLLFTCKNYTIEKILLNYRIMIKCEKRKVSQKINRDWYSFEDYGIEEAHAMAEYAMAEFFIKNKMPVNPFADR